MNKNLKILSSLVAAGIITATGLTANVSAATPKSLGVYRKLVEGKTIAPYILAKATDSLTQQNIRDDHGTITLNISGNVKTGDTFTKNNETHHIVVYGDVNQDSYIDVNDVSELVDVIVKKDLNRFSDVQKQAANVAENINNNKELNVNDVSTLVDYIVKDGKFEITLKEENEQPSVNYNYTITANDNGYITTNNITKTKFFVGIKTPVSQEKKLKIKVLDENGNDITTTIKKADGSTLERENQEVTIKPKMTEIETELLNFEDVVLKNLKGKVAIQLIEKVNKKDTIVGESIIQINTQIPQATNVRTRRTGEYTATMSLEKLGESDIVKMYYQVAKASDPVPTLEDENTKVITIHNNKLENFEIANNLESGSEYIISYKLENSYGSKTDKPIVANIANDENTSVEKPVAEIKVPTLEEATAEFSWTLQDGQVATGKTFAATLYKNGIAVAKKEVSSVTKVDFATEIKNNKAGLYTIKVYVKAGATSQDSDIKESAAIKVENLMAVQNVQFTTKVNGSRILTWTDSNAIENVKDYTVKLIPYKANGEEDTNNIKTITGVNSKELKLEGANALTMDTIYKAEVTVCAKENQLKVVDSAQSQSTRFFAIEAPTVVAAETTDNSITLQLANYITVNNKKATYSVKVYKAKENIADMLTDAAYEAPTLRENVTVNDKKIVIDGLETKQAEGVRYAFQIIAEVDAVEGQSIVLTGIETKAKMPEVREVTVVKNANEAKEKTIFYNAPESKLVIEGKAYDVSASSKYPELLKKVAQIVNVLQAKDIMTLEQQTVKLELKSEQTNSTALALGELAKGMKLEITGNGFGKTITTSESGKPAQVVLSGNGAIFTVAGLNAQKVTLNNGVDVKGDIKYTVSKGSTVTINGVKVTSKQDVEIAAQGKKLEITANNVTNELEFENLTDANHTDKNGDEVEISFKGDNETTYAGIIKITSNKGKITVKENNVGVSNVTLDVVVTDTDVDVSGFAQANNNVKITVSEDAGAAKTVKAKAKIKAPKTMNKQLLKIYGNTVEEDNAIKADFGVTTEKEIQDIRTFINSFGIEEIEGATITTTENSYDVTIEFGEKTLGEVSIEGID